MWNFYCLLKDQGLYSLYVWNHSASRYPSTLSFQISRQNGSQVYDRQELQPNLGRVKQSASRQTRLRKQLWRIVPVGDRIPIGKEQLQACYEDVVLFSAEGYWEHYAAAN